MYRIKQEHNGGKRYKTRLVMKGFQQKKNIDFNEFFSPVLKLNTIRIVLSIAVEEDLFIEQMDVKIAFLHGDLEK